MDGTTSLSKEQIFIIKAIINQREKSQTDFFEYSPLEAVKFLSEKYPGTMSRLMISTAKHFEILESLHKIISITILDIEVAGVGFHDASLEAIREEMGDDEAFEIALKFGRVFIRISYDEIQAIRDKYGKKYDAELEFDKDCVYFYIAVLKDDKQIRYSYRALSASGHTHDVINYVINESGKVGELVKKTELAKFDKYFAEHNIKDLFKSNTTIKVLLAPFIELASDGICIRLKASITQSQADIIEKESIRSDIVRTSKEPA